ncbi:MCP four helix bundle domain-containing protein [Paraburkholderia sp. FT54]|uniref:MCP four helix bundle domain-containing protein n=1 Tax=Paraburkholderia sp. FT54 TaxID=3074437 RepID=UPI002877D6FA|nr:MCP four helix bundle domain-containing protein [Paraburkholderia sp. FT54]WNC94970.1 MCP four helix bundle domain-containing protein [Paraburkholderia sp. FT54]
MESIANRQFSCRSECSEPVGVSSSRIDASVPKGAIAEISRCNKSVGLSVKAMLRLAFGSLLASTVVVGSIALIQIRGIGKSTQLIYDQGYVASIAAEEARDYMLRASRAQKSLLTASTAKERDNLGAEIDSDLDNINQQLATIQSLSNDADSIVLDKKLGTAINGWSVNLRAFVKLVKGQSIDLSQMNWQVGTMDGSGANRMFWRDVYKWYGCLID